LRHHSIPWSVFCHCAAAQGKCAAARDKEFVMRLTLAIMLVLSFSTAQAATPAAWQALDAAARAGCGREIVRLASKAKVGSVTGRVSGIGATNDADRYYALILDGRTAGFKSQWLCLYDKRSKQAMAREIETR
jgi:hypothetical protein